ncbi:hypothetical protein Tco_0856540 [Tanacetum coccineum]|uniref:Uncharacterized protein n=1 Tax=Tanacetum coccineum TaxID=301880 RepID=A0ABQ5B7I8_9ASTR
MSSGSQTVGDVVILKFDMHVYTSVLTSDEVKSLVVEYTIPSDLHPCGPPSGLTMNRLPIDKICIYDQYLEPLEINHSVNLFRAFYKLNKQGHWFSFERHSGKGGQGKIFNEFCISLKHCKDCFFLIDRRAIPDAMSWRHQDSSVSDPPPTGVRAKDIHRLYENLIDLCLVYSAMLYAIGLTTIWKHVGHHPVFKDGEGTVATNMSQILKFLMAGGVHVGKGTALATNEVIPQHTNPPLPSGSQILEKSDHQKVVKYENERVLSAKRKAQAAKDRAVWKRAATEGASHRPKKKKTTPFSFALSDSEADGSNRSGSGTHHSASPLNTIIPNEAELTTGVDGPILESVNRAEEDTDHNLDNVEDTTKINSPLSEHSSRSQHSNPSDEDTHNVRNESSHTHASGSTVHGVSSSSGGSHRQAFLRCNLGGDGIGSSLRGDRYKALNEDYRELYESYRSCQDVFDSKESDLTEKLVAVEKERDDLLDKNREREERIKQLEANLDSKTSSLIEAEGVVSTLKGDLERLTVDLSHADLVRHNYVRQLLPTVFQRLLFSDEYKKSLSDVFNLAIAAGCYPYVEKLVESFRLPLGDLHNMWPEGALLGHRLLDSFGASCVPGNVRHLAIGTWTHLERLAFWVMRVTWSLALGLIRSVLRFG